LLSEAAAGVVLSGTADGLAAGATVEVSVVDGTTTAYTATVNGAGTGWTAWLPVPAAQALANGTATVSAQVTDTYGTVAQASGPAGPDVNDGFRRRRSSFCPWSPG
jgi:hypothetical protein